MAENPGRCRQCHRRYADYLFNVEEFIKKNMTGIKYVANKSGCPIEDLIEKDRRRHAAWLAERGYENCERLGCKKAIKPTLTEPAEPLSE